MDIKSKLLPLARWVATYKRSHGKAPGEAEVPAELAPLWTEFQASKATFAASIAASRPPPRDPGSPHHQKQNQQQQQQQQQQQEQNPKQKELQQQTQKQLIPADDPHQPHQPKIQANGGDDIRAAFPCQPIWTKHDSSSPARAGASAQGVLSPSRRAARPVVARALRHAYMSGAAAIAAAAAEAAEGCCVKEPDGDADAEEGNVALDGKENHRMAAAAAMPPMPPPAPSYGTPARARAPRREWEGACGGGGLFGTPGGGPGSGAGAGGGDNGDTDDDLEEVPPTPLSQIRKSGPGGGRGSGRRQGVHGGVVVFSPPRPSGGAESAVKETPPESLRRRSRLFGDAGGFGAAAAPGGSGRGGVPLSPVPCRLSDRGGDGLFGGRGGGGGGLFDAYTASSGGQGLFGGTTTTITPSKRVTAASASPGQALARQLMQRRSIGGSAAAIAAPSAATAAIAKNPYSRVANMRAAARRESEAAAAAAAAVAAMQEEEAAEAEARIRNAASKRAAAAAAAAPAASLTPSAAGSRRPSGVSASDDRSALAAAAPQPPATMAASATGVTAAAAAAAATTPLRLLRRAQQEQQQVAAAAAAAGVCPPGSPFSPIPMRRRQVPTGAMAAAAAEVVDANADAAAGVFFAARGAATSIAMPSEVAAAAWKLTGGAEPDADDVALRRRAEGYDALAADADAALLLGGGGNGAEGMDTAAAAGMGSRKGTLYGDAQAEMRRLLVEQASEAVDLDKLALLGPKGAAAAGIRSPGAATAPAVRVAERGADGRQQSRVSEPLAVVFVGTTTNDNDPDTGPGGEDDAECDVAEELLPAAVREQIRQRRQVLRRQRRGAPATEPADATAAASGTTSRREALLRQLVGHRTVAEAGSGGGGVSIRTRRTAHAHTDARGPENDIDIGDLGGSTAPLPLGSLSGPAAQADGGGDGVEDAADTDGRSTAETDVDEMSGPDGKFATAAGGGGGVCDASGSAGGGRR
ncbi:hypothetical protein Vafri_19049, partial [Volvox africanus]